MNSLKICFFSIFCLITCLAFTQDTTYYDSNGEKVDSLHLADHYEVVFKNQTDSNRVVEKNYYLSGQLKSEIHYYPYHKLSKNGKRKEWYENGQLKKDIWYVNDTIEGQLLSYWENGQVKRDDYYEMGELIEGKVWDESGNELEYYDFFILAEFPGGVQQLILFLQNELKYPEKAKEENIEGRVLVTFIVDTMGAVKEVEIKEGVHELLDNEAIRVVKKLPNFHPGMEDGEKVEIRFNLPINFDMRKLFEGWFKKK